MQSIPIADVQIIDRQRKEIGQTDLQKLKVSILSKGLLHAPVLSTNPDGTYRLLAGERRLRAITQLHEESHVIYFNASEIPQDHIPFVNVSDLSPADRMEAELEENLLRKDLTWMEKQEALAALHDLRSTQNPAQDFKATGKELSSLRGTSVAHEAKEVARAKLIMAHKDNPAIQRSKTAEEAHKRILDENESRFKALLALTKEPDPDSAHTLHHGDCREIMKTLADGCCNTIIADPPYGIDAHQSGQESKHFYDDSPEYALEICKVILREGFRCLSQRGILLMFTDIEHFITLREEAKRQAYSVYRTPIIWHKDAGGRTPWGRAGFKRSYEIILFAVKGQDELKSPGGNDVLTFKQSSRSERDHAANKPQALLEHLIRLTTLKGQTILDPTCGSGTIIPAANACGVRTICIEMDSLSYSKALNRSNGSTETDAQEENLEIEEDDFA